jgi:hypothetical protein
LANKKFHKKILIKKVKIFFFVEFENAVPKHIPIKFLGTRKLNFQNTFFQKAIWEKNEDV